MIRFPGPGCLVEYMQGNHPQQAIVLEEQSGSLRLYTIGRRETKMPLARLLPWFGPAKPLPATRQEMQELLEQAHARRQALAAEVDPLFLWDLAKDEIAMASPRWFAEILWQQPDEDQVAAVGHALLECKTHFKFGLSEFEIFSQDKVEARLREAEINHARAEFLIAGRSFVVALWEAHQKIIQNQQPPALPELKQDIADRLENFLHVRLVDPEDHETSSIWKDLAKSLPDLPYLPLLLLQAWGKVPAHYNFALERIGYDPGNSWYLPHLQEIEQVLALAPGQELEFLDKTFVSIDTQETEDLDDAFCLEKDGEGNFILYLAIASPAFGWNFGAELDKAVLRRASSIYLPEGSLHMMPEPLGIDGYSLMCGHDRAVMLAELKLSPEGEPLDLEISLKRVNVAANLIYEDCEALFDPDFIGSYEKSGYPLQAEQNHQAQQNPQGQQSGSDGQNKQGPQGEHKLNPAEPYREMLTLALNLGEKLQDQRITRGAVVIKRSEPKIVLKEKNNQIYVEVLAEKAPDQAQMLIGEFMVLLNASIAKKGAEWNLPLIYRTQHVTLPKEYAGIWEKQEDISRIVKAMPPASIEDIPRPHAGLGLPAYATISSPLRRYTDLFNQGQVLHYIKTGAPLFNQEQLSSMLPLISARSEAVNTVQKQRPRYWKLVYFKQQGDKKWYEAVISEENDLFVTVSLYNEQLHVRSKRAMFGDKVMLGQHCQVRIGKVFPLNNEIQLLAVEEC